MPEWQQSVPQSTAVCSLVGKLVGVDDCMALRPALGMKDSDVEAPAQSDVVGWCRRMLVEYQPGPLGNYLPYSTLTEPTLRWLAE